MVVVAVAAVVAFTVSTLITLSASLGAATPSPATLCEATFCSTPVVHAIKGSWWYTYLVVESLPHNQWTEKW